MNLKLNQTFANNTNDLIEIQKSNFYHFLLFGLGKELNSVISNPFFLTSFEKHSLSKNVNNKKIVFSSSLNSKNKNDDNDSTSLAITTTLLHNFQNSDDSQTIIADVYLHPSKLKIKGPTKSLYSCFQRGETYATNVYIQGEIIQNFCQEIKISKKSKHKKGILAFKFSSQLNAFRKPTLAIKKYFYLATIPFLTEDGSFFVNGCERVVVNQIIRSPGIYFKKEYVSFQKITYTATFISNNWVWTKFILDNTISRVDQVNQTIDLYKENPEKLQNKLKAIPEKYDIYLNISDSNFWSEILPLKDPLDGSNELLLIDLILKLGFTFEEIFDNLKYPNKLSFPDIVNDSRFLNESKIKIAEKHNLDENDSESSINLVSNFVDHIFSENQEKRYFSLSELGRYKLNKRLGLNLPLSATYLTGLDFLKIIDCLITFKEENLISDDIDDLKNKQIRSVGDLIQNQFRLALFKYLKSPNYSDEIFLNLKPEHLLKQYKEIVLQKKKRKLSLNSFFLSETLRKSIDRNLREFFLTSQLSQYFDETNPLAELAHKRRISVFGPQGLQREKINTRIRDIHPSQYGKICPIETPEGENAGLVMSLASFARVNHFGWIESPYFISNSGKILSQTKPFYLNSNQEEEYNLAFANNFLNQESLILNSTSIIKKGLSFFQIESKDVDFSALSQLQILSIGTILIPFVEHNDGNRALMGSNMQRQALPLLYPQNSLIGTGFESNVALESGLTVKSETEGLIEFVSSHIIEVGDYQNQKIRYKLQKYRRSNQETCNTQFNLFWPGEKVYAGQILADSSSTLNGELALGTNLFIGYLPWEGYNYEDAIVINENLIKQNTLTSLHISIYETNFKPTKVVLKKLNYLLKATRKIRNLKKNFQQIKIAYTKPLKKENFIKLLKRISREIFKVRFSTIKDFTEITSNSEDLISKEKSSFHISKSNSYLKRHLSSNGIIKIGAHVSGGDILVSKIQAIDNSNPKSSYQKLFEELQFGQLKDLESKKSDQKRKQKLKKRVFSHSIESTKIFKIINYIKFLNFSYFKIVILLNRLSFLKKNLNKFLKELTTKKFSKAKILYLKSLKIKYKNQKNHLRFLMEQASMQKSKKEKVGFYLVKLYKLLLQNLYKRTYQNFYLSRFKKKYLALLEETNSNIIHIQKFKLKKSVFLLDQIYKNLKEKVFENIKETNFYSTFFNKLKPCFNTNFDKTLSIKNFKILLFKKDFTSKIIEQVFLGQLATLHNLTKRKKNYFQNTKLESLNNIQYKNSSLLMPLGSEGKVIDLRIFPSTSQYPSLLSTSFTIKIFVLEERKIQVGDKLSGRHGNKGVISRILPSKDMPLLPDGTVLDILINPLGVPSRMNVGQLLECLLGISSFYLEKKFKVKPFDENFGKEASRIFATQKLKEAALLNKQPWLYNQEHPGKFYLRDGRTGEFFDNPITVGVAYILKLIHLVEDKIHSRALGPYNKVTEQPLQGKASNGGQRFGEMEVWALEAYGCANTLQELLTVKSDDIDGRTDLYKSISNGDPFNKPNPNFSETFICLIRELNSLGLDFQFFKAFSEKNILKTIDSTTLIKKEMELFQLLEERLKLRFKSNELKFRYPDFERKNSKLEQSEKVQFEKQTKYLLNSLENFSLKKEVF